MKLVKKLDDIPKVRHYVLVMVIDGQRYVPSNDWGKRHFPDEGYYEACTDTQMYVSLHEDDWIASIRRCTTSNQKFVAYEVPHVAEIEVTVKNGS